MDFQIIVLLAEMLPVDDGLITVENGYVVAWSRPDRTGTRYALVTMPATTFDWIITR